jgi:predicted nucleic acid-binding protein
LDTDVMIAALDRRDSHHRQAAGGLRAMMEQEITLMLSLVNYAETLVRPAEDERTLHTAIDAIASIRVKLVAPTPQIARDAARYRTLDVSLADGFAMATACAHKAALASFDKRVRRALAPAGLELTPLLG